MSNNLTNEQIRQLYMETLKNKEKIYNYTYNNIEKNVKIGDIAETILKIRKTLNIPSYVDDEKLLIGFLPQHYEIFEAEGDKVFNYHCLKYLKAKIPKKVESNIVEPIGINEIKIKEGLLRGNKHMLHISKKNGLFEIVKDLYINILNVKATPSKLVPDIFESIIGIIIDSNNDIDETFKWIEENLVPYYDLNMINKRDPYSTLNLYIQGIVSKKKLSNPKFHVNNKDYITVISSYQKGQFKCNLMIPHPNIFSEHIACAIPIIAPANGRITWWNSRPLGYKPLSNGNFEKWLKKNSNERIKWVNDIRYNNLSAKELLSYKENKEDKDKIHLNHGITIDTSATVDLLTICVGKRNGKDEFEKIVVPPGSYITSFNKFNKDQEIKKGDLLGYIYFPQMLIYGKGYNKNDSEACHEAALTILAKKGDKLKEYYGKNFESEDWKKMLEDRKEFAKARQKNNNLDYQTMFKLDRKRHNNRFSNNKSNNNKSNNNRSNNKANNKANNNRSNNKKFSIFIKNMAWGKEEEIIRSHFKGNINFKIVTDKNTNKSKGIAFVEFDNKKDRDNAVNFNNTKIFGRKISVESK
jgi:dsRNA-specific ribonuclease